MTDTRTDLPSREEILDREFGTTDIAKNRPLRFIAAGILDSLTLLDLAAEMQRRGAEIAYLSGPHRAWHPKIRVVFDAPQQEDTAE